jgi:Tfp pilus assembly protein PilF
MGAGQPSRARAAFDRALAIAPADEDARRGAIGSHLAARDIAGARARLARWVEDSTANPAVQVLAARVDLADQAPAAAERRLLDVIRTAPDQLEAYELLGMIYVTQGNTSAALDKYRALAARAPDPTGPATVVGMLLDSGTNRQAARAQYEAVLARNPRAGVAANNLAWLLAEAGEYDEALRWAEIAAETLRGRPEPQDTLGWVHLKRNNRVDALAAFERALSLAPDNRLYQEHKAAASAAVAAR